MSTRHFANTVLMIGGLIFMGLIGYFTYKSNDFFLTTPIRVLLFLGPAAAASLCFSCLRLNIHLKVAAALVIVAAFSGIYAAEIFLTVSSATTTGGILVQGGQEYDARDKSEVVRSLREKGLDAYPAISPGYLIENETNQETTWPINIDDKKVIPLGGLANRTTVYCNESGKYLIYDSDEHGFHNPRGVWQSSDIYIAAVGDSFTQGFCVDSRENFVAQIRKHYPATLNLGMSGNGPLLILANIQEFLSVIKPRIVLWFFFEGNDLLNLKVERENAIIFRYLLGNDRQGLISRQEEIDRQLAAYIESKWSERRQEKTYSRFRNIVKLRRLRHALGLIYSQGATQIELFQEILEKARDMVRSWGGELIFVYLPKSGRYGPLRRILGFDLIRENVIGNVKALGVPFVDVYETFRAQGDPARLFFFAGSHYNPQGHLVVANSVLEFLATTDPASQ